jgi:hypothetical protein
MDTSTTWTAFVQSRVLHDRVMAAVQANRHLSYLQLRRRVSADLADKAVLRATLADLVHAGELVAYRPGDPLPGVFPTQCAPYTYATSDQVRVNASTWLYGLPSRAGESYRTWAAAQVAL